jgi:hypothetical protein
MALLPIDAQNIVLESITLEKVPAGTSGTETVCSTNGPTTDSSDCREWSRTVYRQALVARVNYTAASERHTESGFGDDRAVDSEDGQARLVFNLDAAPELADALANDRRLNRRNDANQSLAQNNAAMNVREVRVSKSVIDYDRSELCGVDSDGNTERGCSERIVYKKVPSKAKRLKITL